MVFFLDLVQVAYDLSLTFFSIQHPVPQKCITGHEGGDEDGPQQIPLNFGVYVITGQGQFPFRDLGPKQGTGDKITGQAGGAESDNQDNCYEYSGFLFFYHAYLLKNLKQYA